MTRERMKPMSEAPRDGTAVVLWWPDPDLSPDTCRWSGESWCKRTDEGDEGWSDSAFAGWTPIVRPLTPDAPEPAEESLPGRFADPWKGARAYAAREQEIDGLFAEFAEGIADSKKPLRDQLRLAFGNGWATALYHRDTKRCPECNVIGCNLGTLHVYPTTETKPTDESLLRPIEDAPKDKPALGWYEDQHSDPIVVRWRSSTQERRDGYNTTRRVEFYTLLPVRPIPRLSLTAQIPADKADEFRAAVTAMGGKVRDKLADALGCTAAALLTKESER